MRKILTRLLLTVLALVLLLIILGLFLPSSVHVERSVVVNAPGDVILKHVEDLRQWPKWSAWNVQYDPTIKFNYEGAEKGVGAIYIWKGDKAGAGRLEITDSSAQTGVKYKLAFEGMGAPTEGMLKFEPRDKSTKLTWQFDEDAGMNIIGRYFNLIMDGMLGPDFEKGLANLKKLAEEDPAASTSNSATASP